MILFWVYTKNCRKKLETLDQGSATLQPMSQQPSVCFVAFTFLNGFLKSEEIFVTREYYMKFTFQCSYISFPEHSHASFILLVQGCFCNVAKLCCVKNHLANKA